MMQRIITFLSDFGSRDGYVASVKGVLVQQAPETRIIDAAHDIPAFNIHCAAYALLNYYDTYPPGTVHLVVVDPGVGSERRAVVVKTMHYYFVGPDNGVFSFVLKREAYQAYEIIPEALGSDKISYTFHGRDIFAPAAAMLARGINPSDFARPLDDLNHQDPAFTRVRGNYCQARVVAVDHFGNVITGLAKADLKHWHKKIKAISYKNVTINRINDYYAQAPAGQPMALWNSQDMLEIALRQESAAMHFATDIETDVVEIQLEDAD